MSITRLAPTDPTPSLIEPEDAVREVFTAMADAAATVQTTDRGLEITHGDGTMSLYEAPSGDFGLSLQFLHTLASLWLSHNPMDCLRSIRAFRQLLWQSISIPASDGLAHHLALVWRGRRTGDQDLANRMGACLCAENVEARVQQLVA